MRFLITFSFPSETGNKKIAQPEFGAQFGALFKEIGAEAAYLCPVGGQRGGYVVVNFTDASMIGSIAEKFWLWLNADIEITPVMVPDDLVKAMPEIKTSVHKYS